MKKILVLQHIAREPLGTLNPLFKEQGFRIRYVNFWRHPQAKVSLDGYHGLVILGGPMNVDEIEKHPHLAHEVELIQEAIKRELPVLGICLGAQLIAKALGAKVHKNKQKEIGWFDVELTEEGRKDPLFHSFQPTEKIFQWHGDAFTLPKGALHLASSPLCANQAFRYGEKVYGFQFHLEVDERIVHRWVADPANGPDVDAQRIMDETPHYIDRLKDLSRETFGQFIQLFGNDGAARRRRRLVSR